MIQKAIAKLEKDINKLLKVKAKDKKTLNLIGNGAAGAIVGMVADGIGQAGAELSGDPRLTQPVVTGWLNVDDLLANYIPGAVGVGYSLSRKGKAGADKGLAFSGGYIAANPIDHALKNAGLPSLDQFVHNIFVPPGTLARRRIASAPTVARDTRVIGNHVAGKMFVETVNKRYAVS